MGTLREEEFETFLKRRLTSSNGLLIHGVDQAAVSLLARRVISTMKGEVTQIDFAAAKSAPGGFMDQMLSLSLLGDRQILFVEGADESCLKFLAPTLDLASSANFVLITADSLGKTSKLRAAAEAANLFSSLAIYDEENSVARERVRKLLDCEKLSWSAGAEELFFETVGHERAIVTSETEKLILYSLGQLQIGPEDVAAICGDVAEFELDELVDAILAGNLEVADRIYLALGSDQQRFFPLFSMHLNKLQSLRMDADATGLDAALRNARPPIFFKRKNAFAAQLRALTLEDLVGIQETVHNAIFQSRKLGDLGDAILSRTILAIARLCRSKAAA